MLWHAFLHPSIHRRPVSLKEWQRRQATGGHDVIGGVGGGGVLVTRQQVGVVVLHFIAQFCLSPAKLIFPLAMKLEERDGNEGEEDDGEDDVGKP